MNNQPEQLQDQNNEIQESIEEVQEIEEDDETLMGGDDKDIIDLIGGARKKSKTSRPKRSTKKLSSSPQSTNYAQKYNDSIVYEAHTSDEKIKDSFMNLDRMIQAYSDALLQTLKTTGKEAIMQDVNFLSFNFNENQLRNFFMQWDDMYNDVFGQLKTNEAKKNLQRIKTQMSQWSKKIYNEKITNYNLYMDNVQIKLNKYVSTIKVKSEVDLSIQKDVTEAINKILQGANNTQSMNLFKQYDQKQLATLEFYIKSNFQNNENQYKAFYQFKQLRTQTVNTLLSKLDLYEKMIRKDIESYKHVKPNEKQYDMLLTTFRQLVNDPNGQVGMQTLSQMQATFTSQMDAKNLMNSNQVPSKENQPTQKDIANLVFTKESQITIEIVNQAYKDAFANAVNYINNYGFLLKYCDMIAQIGKEFHMDGFDIKTVITDLIINYYLLLQFIPAKNTVYSRRLTGDKIDNPSTENPQPWNKLTPENGENDFYNSISFIMVNSIRSLYGTFNLLLEYYTKPEKSLSQLILGAAKPQLNNEVNVDAYVFYKIIRIIHESLKNDIQKMTDSSKKGENQQLDLQIMLYPSSKYYKLYQALQKSEFTDEYIGLCNQIWNSTSGSTNGVFSQRLQNVVQGYISEILDNLLTRLYMSDNQDTIKQLDDVSLSFNELRSQSGKLYKESTYQDYNTTTRMPVPDQLIQTKQDYIDLYTKIYMALQNYVKQNIQDQIVYGKIEQDEKLESITQYFEQQIKLYKIAIKQDKPILFNQYMNSSQLTLYQSQSLIQFCLKVGVYLNQYEKIIENIIKIMIIYHKKYVELDNFIESIQKVLSLRIRYMLSDNRYDLSKAQSFEDRIYGMAFNNGIYQRQDTKNIVLSQLDKLQSDIYNDHVSTLSYTIMKLLQKLESNPTNELITDLLNKDKTTPIIQEYISKDTFEEYQAQIQYQQNLPFQIGKTGSARRKGGWLGENVIGADTFIYGSTYKVHNSWLLITDEENIKMKEKHIQHVILNKGQQHFVYRYYYNVDDKQQAFIEVDSIKNGLQKTLKEADCFFHAFEAFVYLDQQEGLDALIKDYLGSMIKPNNRYIINTIQKEGNEEKYQQYLQYINDVKPTTKHPVQGDTEQYLNQLYNLIQLISPYQYIKQGNLWSNNPNYEEIKDQIAIINAQFASENDQTTKQQQTTASTQQQTQSTTQESVQQQAETTIQQPPIQPAQPIQQQPSSTSTAQQQAETTQPQPVGLDGLPPIQQQPQELSSTGQYYIINPKIFSMLTTNLPYYQHAYYEDYNDYQKIVQLLTSIPELQFNGHQIDISKTLDKLHKMKDYILQTFKEFAFIKKNQKTFDSTYQYLSDALNFDEFFKINFKHFCPPPIDFATWFQYTLRSTLMDSYNWTYSIPAIHVANYKMNYQYQNALLSKDPTIYQDGLMILYTPFDLSKNDYTQGLKISNSNPQSQIIDQLNWNIEKIINMLKQYNDKLPLEFYDEMVKNSVISTASQLSTVQVNDVQLNIPLNTVQTPFACPIAYGLESSDYQLQQVTDQFVQEERLYSRIKQEGLFFWNHALDQFIKDSCGLKQDNLPYNLRQQFKAFFNKIIKEEQISDNDLPLNCNIPLITYEGKISDDIIASFQNIFKSFKGVTNNTQVGNLQNNLLVIHYLINRLNSLITGAPTDVTVKNNILNKIVGGDDGTTACFIKEFPQNSYDLMFGDKQEDARSIINTLSTLTVDVKIPQWFNFYSTLRQLVQPKLLYKSMSNGFDQYWDDSGKLIKDYLICDTVYASVNRNNFATYLNELQLRTGQPKQDENTVDIAGVLEGYLLYFINQWQSNYYSIINCSNKIFGDVIQFLLKNNVSVSSPAEDIIKTIFTNDQNRTYILPLPNIIPKQDKFINVMGQNQFNAMNDAVKQKIYKELLNKTTDLIYDQELQKVVKFTTNSQYKQVSNSIMYMSTVFALQNQADIQYSEQQQYNMLYDLAMFYKKLNQFEIQVRNINIKNQQDILSVIETLKKAILNVINKIKSILKKINMEYSKLPQAYELQQRQLLDLVQFNNYDSDTTLMKKVLVELILKQSSLPIDQNLVKHFLLIKEQNELIQKWNIVFRKPFGQFMKAAFIKKRTPSKQIVGVDHYYVLGNEQFTYQKDQQKYRESDQLSNMGWDYDMQHNIKTWKFYEVSYTSYFKLINIQDNYPWSNLFKFQYAYVTNNYTIINPQLLMKEINNYASITANDTIMNGREIYNIHDYFDVNKIPQLTQTDTGRLSYYENSYQALIIQPNGYNADNRVTYLDQPQTAILLEVAPIQYLYQALTLNYKYPEMKTGDFQKSEQENIVGLLYKLIKVQPFNPILLIQKKLPFPVLTMMNLYIQNYERKYLKQPILSFQNSTQQKLYLNQSYNGQRVYVLVEGNNMAGNFKIITSQGIDYYLQTADDISTLTERQIVDKYRTQFRQIYVSQNNVVRDGTEYRLTSIDGKELKEPQKEIEQPLNQLVLYQIFMVIPQYCYVYNYVLTKQGHTNMQVYKHELNGQEIIQPYADNTITYNGQVYKKVQ